MLIDAHPLSLHETALLIFGSILALIVMAVSPIADGANDRSLRSAGVAPKSEFLLGMWHATD